LRRREQRRPDINVTPLVDVVLVLLIIFMVVTPQLEAGAAVELPSVENPDASAEGQMSPIVVSVTNRGAIYVERQPVALDTLRARLREVRDADPERAVLLKGDRSASFDRVRPVLEVVQDLGFPGASLQVGERKDTDEEKR
jgi:biopolymer transport protein ExbD